MESSPDVNAIIDKLLIHKGCRSDKRVDLSEDEILYLCHEASKEVERETALLRLNGTFKIVGSIYSGYPNLLRVFEYGGFPPDSFYLFLGNYCDRGKQGIECICLLMAYKIKYPESIYLLRGKHDCSSISRIYGFYDECKKRLVTNTCLLYFSFSSVIN